jgi:hypothetical protein
MRVRRAAAGVLVAVAVLVPVTAASASHHRAPKLPLALVPLQKAQLGAAGKSFKLDYGSGPTFISNVGLKAFDVRNILGTEEWAYPAYEAHYSLDYGDAFTGSTGVMEIRTSVEEYKTPAAAKKAYLFWKHVDSSLRAKGLGGAWKPVHVPAVGPRHFAYRGTWQAPNLNPIVGLDEQVLAGRFVLDLTVTAGSPTAAEDVAPGLARRLYHHLQSMLRGHLAGSPAKVPRKPKAGRAAGGPDLSTMILQPSDVGQSQTPAVSRKYWPFLPALSAYEMNMQPAGLYDGGFYESIFWWPTATEATYAEAYLHALDAKAYGASPVDLSAVGDNATGSIADFGENGSLALVTLSNAQAGVIVVGGTSGTGPAPTASDVQSLAQAAANRLDAGLGP